MTLTEHLQCREIITKAVCGKGRKFSQATHIITPPAKPTGILGCWIINHTYEAEQKGDLIEVVGTYDINVWFSHENNTKTDVAKETVSYVEHVPLSYLDHNHLDTGLKAHAEATQQPNCIDAAVQSDGSVLIKVEREFAVEVIGETKINVVVCPDDGDDKGFEFEDEFTGIVDDESSNLIDDLEADVMVNDIN